MTVYPSPKLNVGLNVLRKRPDGYHDLESLFIPYRGMNDVLDIQPASKFSIQVERFDLAGRSIPPGWNPMDDLCVKAWKILARDYLIPPVAIRLEKHVPVGAGLGGGSADGAATLRVLSEMFDLFLPDVMLEIYAAELGSDCPFFIYDRPMFVSGRGEELEEYDFSLPEAVHIEVELPEAVSVPTALAYRGIVPSLPSVPLRDALRLPLEEWKDNVFNDFEKSVFAQYPQIASLKQSFYDRGAVYASMSGSGSAVFGFFRK